MAVRLRCSQGHEWELAPNSGATLLLSDGKCPVCSRESEHLSMQSDGSTWDSQRTAPYSGQTASPAGPMLSFPGYEVMAELGRGGMGVVYRARQESLKRIVALKVPHATASAFARFRSEAELVAQLRHPNIVQVFDFAECKGRPFFAMEFLDGGTLADKLGSFMVPARPATRIVATLARAVHAANSAGVIHRDLKPANVLLTTDGTPKISDFGLALDTQPDHQANADGVEGTPSYMAPEQAAGDSRKIDARTDVYGLGAILYRLLAGRAPFEGRNVVDTLQQVLQGDLVSPRRLQPTIPRDLEAICLRCLAREPNRRYSTAAELADDLDRFLAGDPVQARSAPLLERTMRLIRRKPARIMATTLLAALAVGALWYWHARLRETTDYFADRIYRWGAPVGLDPLTAEEVRHREASLRFHSRGGRVERIEVVNSRGELTTRHRFGSGIATVESWLEIGRPECQFVYAYDDAGRVVSETANDAESEMVWSFQFTSPTGGYYKDRRGFPAPQAVGGATYIEYVFNADGRPELERYRDASANPKPDGLGSYGSHNAFDEHGRVIRQTFIDRNDQPMLAFGGMAGTSQEYDDRGRLVRGDVLDINGRRATAGTGISIVRFEYDRWGNVVHYAYYDEKDKPCRWNGDYHGFTIEHDELGRMIRLSLFDENGRPVRCRDGYAEIRAEYDSGNLPIRESYWDESGRRCGITAGFSRMDRSYNRRGDPLDESFFDVNDLPTVGPNGFHRALLQYSRGDRTEIRMIGIDGKPSYDKNNVCRQRYVFNDRHQCVRIDNLDADGNPVLSGEGIAAWTIGYDGDGNDIEHRFLGLDGKPARNLTWSAMERYRYDSNGRKVKTTSFDLPGRELVWSVAVYEVISGRPAEKAGLRVGDAIERLIGEKVTDIERFKSLLDKTRALSPPYELVVRRDGQLVTIRFDEQPAGFSFAMRLVLP